jgi:hypothetical protein
LVRLGEFRGEVGEVCEGKLARIGAVANAEEAEVAFDEVAVPNVSTSGLVTKLRGRVRAKLRLAFCYSIVYILVCVCATLYARLWLRVAV